jgi:hypothetical protein
MQQNLHYDPVALKTRLAQRHGSDLGQIIFDAEVNRRRIQDERCAELNAELTAIHNQISERSSAAAQRLKTLQTHLGETYAVYLSECAEAAKVDSMAQAQIAPLSARSLEIQEQLRTLVQPRLTERELQDVAIYNSMNSELKRKPAARHD